MNFNFRNAYLHFKKICIHKYWVAKYCFRCGLYWQGIIHDLSKFSPVEFFESVEFYQGTRSPIDACKALKGYSGAWMHHKGRNPHHYEYWVDNLDYGGIPLSMPKKYAIEMLCDYIGAGHAYSDGEFSYEAEYKWWLNKKSHGIKMHPKTIEFVDTALSLARTFGDNVITKESLDLLWVKVNKKS